MGRSIEGDGGVNPSQTRNSAIRRKTLFLTEGIAGFIDKKLPGLTPTHLNILGAALVAAGSVLAIEDRRKVAATGLIATGSLIDAIDGPLARKKAQNDPTSIDFEKGQIYDALSDRTQELSLALARAVDAHKRGNRIGELLALTTAATSSWSSISRATAESSGRIVPESGKGLSGLIGTRVGGAVTGSIATILPEIKGVPIQPVIDVLMTVSKIKTAIDRMEALGNKEVSLPKETRDEARNRLKALGIFGIIATGASLFTYWRLNNDRNR